MSAVIFSSCSLRYKKVMRMMNVQGAAFQRLKQKKGRTIGPPFLVTMQKD